MGRQLQRGGSFRGMFESLDPRMPEALLPWDSSLTVSPKSVFCSASLRTQLRHPALPRHERYLSSSGICSDFIAPSSPICSIKRSRAAPEEGALPLLGPFSRGGGNPCYRPFPGLTEGGTGPSKGLSWGGPRKLLPMEHLPCPAWVPVF